MRAKDWPLVIFSLLTQAAVGSFWALGLGDVGAGFIPARDTLISIFAFLIVSVSVATFHLHRKERAYLVLSNLGSSWLSREAMLGAVFGLSVTLFAAFHFVDEGRGASSIVALIGSAVGVALVFCISRLYMLRTVPAWNSWTTPAQFFLAALLLGAAAVGSASALFFAPVQIAVSVLAVARSTVKLSWKLAILRAALTLSGAAWLYFASGLHSSGAGFAAFSLIFFGELLGRFMFFASYDRVGI